MMSHAPLRVSIIPASSLPPMRFPAHAATIPAASDPKRAQHGRSRTDAKPPWDFADTGAADPGAPLALLRRDRAHLEGLIARAPVIRGSRAKTCRRSRKWFRLGNCRLRRGRRWRRCRAYGSARRYRRLDGSVWRQQQGCDRLAVLWTRDGLVEHLPHIVGEPRFAHHLRHHGGADDDLAAGIELAVWPAWPWPSSAARRAASLASASDLKLIDTLCREAWP